MWSTDGEGGFNVFLPDGLLTKRTTSKFGDSIGTGNFTFAAGNRTTVAQRLKLNDAGKENGELELFVDGVSVISVDGLKIRESKKAKIRGLQIETFFGGELLLP